ncbi:MAG: helix-turn-helix transcriptional regulator [Clostridiales bacterium]|nr:helix-turn-helix transcriptional regulator [Clostridiales bacterium]
MEKKKHNTARIRNKDGSKNLISERLLALRTKHRLSQRALAAKLQTCGYDIDYNVICRIENNERFVTDFEIKALCSFFKVSYQYLIDGNDESQE